MDIKENNGRFYNVHGIILFVDKNSLSANFIHLLLVYFEVKHNDKDKIDIQIVGEDFSVSNSGYLVGRSSQYHDNGSGKFLKDNDLTLKISDDGKITLFSKKHIFPHILLQMVMVFKGITLVHGACISRNNKVLLFPAWSRAGKTTLILRYLRDEKVQFFGEDFVFVSEDGDVYNFPHPFTLNKHQAFSLSDPSTHSKIQLGINKVLPSFQHVKKVLRPVAAKFPRLDFLRVFWPGNIVAQVTEIIPRERIATTAPVDEIIYLARYSGKRPQIKDINQEDLVSKVVGILYYELQQNPFWHKFILCSAWGIINISDYYNATAKILRSAFQGKTCKILMVPECDNLDEMADTLIGLLDG